MDRSLENNIEFVETNSTHETDVPNESISNVGRMLRNNGGVFLATRKKHRWRRIARGAGLLSNSLRCNLCGAD